MPELRIKKLKWKRYIEDSPLVATPGICAYMISKYWEDGEWRYTAWFDCDTALTPYFKTEQEAMDEAQRDFERRLYDCLEDVTNDESTLLSGVSKPT